MEKKLNKIRYFRKNCNSKSSTSTVMDYSSQYLDNYVDDLSK